MTWLVVKTTNVGLPNIIKYELVCAGAAGSDIVQFALSGNEAKPATVLWNEVRKPAQTQR